MKGDKGQTGIYKISFGNDWGNLGPSFTQTPIVF
jgi:hypothetical protein